MSEPIRILYVDDYPLDRELVRDSLEKEHGGFQVTEAASQAQFVAQLAAGTFDLVLSDFNILGFEGLQVLDAVHASAPHVPVVIVTGTGSEEIAVEAMKRGAADYVIKTPKHIQRLPQTIHAVLEKQRLRNDYERARVALAEERNLLRALIDTIPDFISVKDTAGRFVLSNSMLTSFLGATTPDEVVGKTDFDYYSYEVAVRNEADERAIMQSGQPVMNREEVVEDQTGNRRWLLTTKMPLRNSDGQSLGLITICRDITKRRLLEAQLFQAQKMESIGRLAGGIAHDFNNLLTAMTGYAELALDAHSPTDPARDDIIGIQTTAKRAAGLTRQLLVFAKTQIMEPRVTNLNDLIHDTEQVLRPLISEDIALILRLSADLWDMKADHVQIQQVIINLAINARDAMPTGGQLIIETANLMLDDTVAHQLFGMPAGDYVTFAISDTGVGMDATVQAHLFEPFFTTKGPGRGTGLGLATSYGIVKQHGGNIWFQSAPGRGTTFRIYLPRAVDTPEVQTQTESAPTVVHGTETILLVEDEPTVRALAARVLRAQGYRVLEAANGYEALRLVQEYIEPIHLLLTDVVMPQMGGKMVAEQLKALFPTIKVLFISGYADDTVVRRGGLEPGVEILQKPFSPAQLAQKVRAMLDKY
jgi:PAS domain S-box-containing protein